MASRGPIQFFTDNDVANGVGDALMALGHTVTRLRDVMLNDSPDEVVARACRDRCLVLLTHNVKDFRNIVRKQLGETRATIGALHRIELTCDQARAKDRVVDELPYILAEWDRFKANSEHEIRVEIGNTYVRFNRDYLR